MPLGGSVERTPGARRFGGKRGRGVGTQIRRDRRGRAPSVATKDRLALASDGECGSADIVGWRLFAAVNSPRFRLPVAVSLCGGHLLRDRPFSPFVSHPLEALAVELVEVDAVGLMSDQEIEHGPDERETALLAGEPAHHLGPPFDLAERALEQIR